MGHRIKTEIDNIVLPPELHERSKLGVLQAKAEVETITIQKKRPYQKAIIAAVLVLVVIPALIFNNQVIAALQKAFQFLPGIGIVVEEDTPQQRYVLRDPVTVQIGNGILVITGAVVEDQMTYLTMTGTNISYFESIKLINSEGLEYEMNSSRITRAESIWSGSYWHQGKLDLQQQVHVIIESNPEVVIPLTLTKAESFESYEEMGETAVNDDVRITAIAQRFNDTARILLVSQHAEDLRIADYGFHALHEDKALTVSDETGKRYEFERYMGMSSPAREFFFTLSENDTKKYIITIPEINAVYEDEVNIILDIPTEKEISMEQVFELAGFTVNITKLELIGLNQLRMYVDLGFEEEASKSLHNFHLDRGHSVKLDEKTKTAKFFEFDFEPGSKKVKLKITMPEIIIRGPWIFELPAAKYFEKDIIEP